MSYIDGYPDDARWSYIASLVNVDTVLFINETVEMTVVNC